MKFKTIVILSVGGLGLAALFWFLKPDYSVTNAEVGSELSAIESKSDNIGDQAASEVIRIKIQDGRRTAGPEIIRVSQGDLLTLEFTSDKEGELHLHGYDHKWLLSAGMPVTHGFIAEHSGRFEYELHGHHAHHALGVIEVLPR